MELLSCIKPELLGYIRKAFRDSSRHVFLATERGIYGYVVPSVKVGFGAQVL